MILHLELSNAELHDLNATLHRLTLGKGLSVIALDGFLTAIAIGPRIVLPSEWLPWVWDAIEGTTEPGFVSQEEAKAVVALLLRHNQAVEQRLWDDYAAEFEPLGAGDEEGEFAWCAGFMLGTRFDEPDWRQLMQAEPLWFAPMIVPVRRQEGHEGIPEEGLAELRERLVPSVLAIREQFRSRQRAGSGAESLLDFSTGEPSWLDLEFDLDEAEFDELEEKLPAATDGRAMDVVALEGFFVALLVGPALVDPSRWLPWVWDGASGIAEPHFAGDAEQHRVSSLVMRYYHSVAMRLGDRVIEDYEPLIPPGNAAGAALWCAGFLCGMKFDQEEWTRRVRAEPGWFAPVLLPALRLERGEELSDEDLDHFAERLPSSLVEIREYWRRHPRPPIGVSFGPPTGEWSTLLPRRSGSKVGRNELCPCGSGKKYKKCCGVS